MIQAARESLRYDEHMIRLHLNIRVRRENRAALVAFLCEAIPFYESPGGIRIHLVEDLHDPERFIEIVEYATREVYDADQQRVAGDPIMQSYLKRWRTLLDGPPTVDVFADVPELADRDFGPLRARESIDLS